MSKLTRDQFRPYVDITQGAVEGTYDWVRIDKSTLFALSFNANEETYEYIDSANDTTEVTGFAPTMEQEIILDDENPLYQFLEPLFMSRLADSSVSFAMPVMITEPDATGGETYTAWVWDEATLTPSELNTPDGKLSFTINLNGTATKGTATFADDGTVTFTTDSDATE